MTAPSRGYSAICMRALAKIRAQAPILYRAGGRERCRRGSRSRRDEVLIPERIAQVVEALSTRLRERRLKFAAHEMK